MLPVRELQLLALVIALQLDVLMVAVVVATERPKIVGFRWRLTVAYRPSLAPTIQPS